MIPNTSISLGHVYIDINDVPVRPPMQLGVVREPYQCISPGNAMISHYLNTQLVVQQSVGNTIVTMSDKIVSGDMNPTHNNNNNANNITNSTNTNAIDNNVFAKSINSNSNNTTTINTTTSTPKSSPRKQERSQFVIPPRPPSEIGNDPKSGGFWHSVFG